MRRKEKIYKSPKKKRGCEIWSKIFEGEGGSTTVQGRRIMKRSGLTFLNGPKS